MFVEAPESSARVVEIDDKLPRFLVPRIQFRRAAGQVCKSVIPLRARRAILRPTSSFWRGWIELPSPMSVMTACPVLGSFMVLVCEFLR
ncbi:MAG: hypothetical protein ACO3ZW_08500 [Opitutales bacterium]